jgi:hypothetical protein
MKHILRYGTNAEQKYFCINGLDKLYDTIAINANIIAFSPAALANFVVKKTMQKPFFIDPLTHAFQHIQSFICDDSGVKIKKSISKLIDLYGDVLKDRICEQEGKDYIPKKKLSPEEIDHAFIVSFTQHVLDFQKNVSKEKKADEYKAYIDFANKYSIDKVETKLDPEFIVAPYFYLDNISWLDKNIELINQAKEIESEQKVFAQIVLNKRFLEKFAMDDDADDLNKIIDRYASCPADGFLVWIDNYSEHAEVSKSLKAYINLLKGIRNGKNRKVYSLYGSYFSIMLTHSEIGILDGVCHGLEYGEARSVVPVGGGIPTAQFYFFPLHKRIKEAEMFNFLTRDEVKNFHNEICDCKVCKELMGNADDFSVKFSENYGNTEEMRIKGRSGGFITRHYPSTKTKDHSLQHYLHMKRKEFYNIANMPLNDIKKELEHCFTKYQEYFNQDDFWHLSEWKKALDAL